MNLTYAEFCAGYGGLGLAVEEVFGAELKWYSEFDAAPSKIMAHHWPGVPNLGDMTKIDWTKVPFVDVLSGGTPCQDLSAAGRRKGMTEGTRSNLWVHMREAIAVIKPRFVVWENVRGAYSARADSDLEQCPGCVGDPGDERVFLRALGRVLGDLSDLGYDCQWRGLRAADVGGCHPRYRVFILATYTGSQRRTEGNLPAGIGATRTDRTAVSHEPDTRRVRPELSAIENTVRSGGRRGPAVPGNGSGAGTDIALDGADHRSREPWPVVPADTTPDAHRGNDDGRLSDTQRCTLGREAAARSGEGPSPHANPKSIGRGEGWTEPARLEGGPDNTLSSGTNWGEYEPAIRRWEYALGRPAPRPTKPTGRNGGHRLSPRFTEWMMGLPDGWVTAPKIGLTRNEQLKACGNGVVPQQAIAALRDMRQASERRTA